MQLQIVLCYSHTYDMNFITLISEINNNLYIASGSAHPPSENFRVRTCNGPGYGALLDTLRDAPYSLISSKLHNSETLFIIQRIIATANHSTLNFDSLNIEG
jgi:hypothetical protein